MLGGEADGNGGTLLEHLGRRTVSFAGLPTMYWMRSPWNSRRAKISGRSPHDLLVRVAPRPAISRIATLPSTHCGFRYGRVRRLPHRFVKNLVRTRFAGGARWIRTIGPGTKEPVFVAEGELRDRSRAAKKGFFLCGTDGSNPSPSSGESANPRSLPEA